MSERLLWKLYIGVIGAATTIAAQRLVAAGWQAATGEKPPSPTDPEISNLQAVSWALASGIGVGVTQLLVTRTAAKRWATRVGRSSPVGRKFSIRF